MSPIPLIRYPQHNLHLQRDPHPRMEWKQMETVDQQRLEQVHQSMGKTVLSIMIVRTARVK